MKRFYLLTAAALVATMLSGCGEAALFDAIKAEMVEEIRAELSDASRAIDPPPAISAPAQTDTAPTSDGITPEQAKSIALTRAGLTESQIFDYNFDMDDGRYEIDFNAGRYEYDIEIHPKTGEILRFHSEYDD